MLLSDIDICRLQQRSGVVYPFYDSRVQPASYELTLGDRAIFPAPSSIRTWEKPTASTSDLEVPLPVGQLPLSPQQFCLVTTTEAVNLPADIAARVEGKSSLGRFGLAIHTTAGWIDPGFQGQITLELFNCSKSTLWLQAGQKIAQLAFFQLTGPAAKPYGHPDLGSAYQNQVGVTASRGTRG